MRRCWVSKAIIGRIRLIQQYLAGQYCTIGVGGVLIDDDNILISQ